MDQDPTKLVNPALGQVAPGRQVQFPADLRGKGARLPGAGASTFNAAYGRPIIEFQLLHPQAQLPQLGTALAAGYDLVTPQTITLQPNQRTTIPLGFAMALPEYLHGRIESRSGLALKGLVVLTGVIDADYRGELKVIMQNFSDAAHTFAAGDRVAQLVLRNTIQANFNVVTELTSTTRGAGGFGSTGT